MKLPDNAYYAIRHPEFISGPRLSRFLNSMSGILK